MPDYDALRASAREMIASAGNGLIATVFRTERVYDPLTGAETVTNSQFSDVCVKLPIGREDQSTADVGLTLDRKAKVLMPAGNGVPRSGDQMLLGSDPTRWTIIDMPPLDPDGTDLMFRCFVAKGG